MSNIYIQEPHTSGKVVLHTTAGDISIELFSKETPKACRNFVQLALEGQYDGTIFHRIVPGFIIQGGDPTGTGLGGESIYGGPFADEFHTRLRFVRRGLVAMASTGKSDNRSQFFITLDRADELQNKHTIFGKVAGDTIFNVLKIGELEVDENERPLYPPTITSTEVVYNPYDDIVPRITEAEKMAQASISVAQKEEPSKKKIKKNVALLSFGEEAQELDVGNDPNLKIKSSHDLIENDPRLSKELAIKEFEVSSSAVDPKKSKLQDKPQEKVKSDENDGEDDPVAFDRKMRENVRQLQESAKRKANEINNQEQKLSKTDAIRKEIEQVKQDIKKFDQSKDSDNEDEPRRKKVKDSFVEVQRKKYLSSGKALAARRKKGNEAETLEKLKSFQSKLMVAEPTEDTPILTNEDVEPCILHSVPNCLSCRDTFGQPEKEDTDEGWLAHRLVFEKDFKGKNLMQRRDDPDDYVVIDPLERKKQAIEQEKEKRAQKGKVSEVFLKDARRDRDRYTEKHRDSRERDNSDTGRDHHKFNKYESDKYSDKYRDSDRNRDHDRDRDRRDRRRN